MFYYKCSDKILLSKDRYNDLKMISEKDAKESEGIIYILKKMKVGKSRRSFCLSDPSLIFLEEEGINLLRKERGFEDSIPEWLLSKIESGQVSCINTEYPKWKDVLNNTLPPKWKINVFGLGDVGGTLVTGLRLLGGDFLYEIGIYDRRESKIKRWEYEVNQILSPDGRFFPKVRGIGEDELFDCDMFVFCASVGVPNVGDEAKDVRMVQFEGNSRLIGTFAEMARRRNFKGIFAVVSDPVDLLCKSVFISSNRDEKGNMDYMGLAPEQIRGYGLGVMHARAAYYAGQKDETKHYLEEGRAFGPHGEGLIIADSIENYNDTLSGQLTEMARNANIEVRRTGFKPYIAPALSSGSLSIIATIKGEWHYSATFMGGVFIGARNRLLPSGVEIERLDLPEDLYERIERTYKRLESII